MASLTVVGCASGSPLSQAVMARVARDHRLVAIAVPRPRGGWIQRARRILGLSANSLAHLGAPLVDATEIVRLRPDLIVVASFPQILPAATLAVARVGALNVHMSMLPRHRGIDPIFWTYWDDDREAGVTIHWMTDQVDAGDIALQAAVPLERGLPSRDLYVRLTARGVELLAEVLAQVASGSARRQPQDEHGATYESAAEIARARIPLAEWPAERVWHVLRGLGDQRPGLLAEPTGQPLACGGAMTYRLTSDVQPGRIFVVGANYELHCRDGIVVVERGHRYVRN